MFIYWIFSKLVQVGSFEINFIWLIVAITFTVYYWKGINGTFALQRYSMEAKKQFMQIVNNNLGAKVEITPSQINGNSVQVEKNRDF